MIVVEILLISLALLGTTALWIKVFNYLHARKLPRWGMRTLSLGCYLLILLLPIAMGAWYWQLGRHFADLLVAPRLSIPFLYIAVCWVVGGWVAVSSVPRPPIDAPGYLLSNHTQRVDVLAELGQRYDGPRWTTALARIPGNELLQLCIHEKQLAIPRLPKQLEGLAIAHLSDLHYTGKVGKAYFEEIVRRTNEFDADLIAITGDLLDCTVCLDWIRDTFGRLRAKHGVYFVLGNHDLLVDATELRQRLTDAGLTDLGGRHTTIAVHGCDVTLAGNELPWFAPAAEMQTAPARSNDSLRIVLSHSPDQFGWAREHDADLMLAGHTHGGQIRLPLIGAVVAPSRYGTRYACGTFFEPPTVMHVSRGISGTTPIRVNCPPELSKIDLVGRDA
jgi:hypothetical protein